MGRRYHFQLANGVLYHAYLDVYYWEGIWQCSGEGIVGCGSTKEEAVLDWAKEMVDDVSDGETTTHK